MTTDQHRIPFTEARDTFLAHFPPTKRSTVSNWFLGPIREQRTQNPQTVVQSVLDMLYRRLESGWASEQSLTDASNAIEAIQQHRAEALGFAEYYISYENLPEDERAALKQAQREEGIAAYMAAQQPTAKQIGYLQRLGYAGPAPTTMAEASAQIDRLVAARGKAARR